MNSPNTCKECGTAIPADSPEGFCAQCLLGLGLERTASLPEGHHSPPLSAVPLKEKPGDRIDRYRLLQEIGHGGCGVVYMAEQKEPIHRRVALKVIKLGMDTKQVVARFEAERQALALMDHPNIAKVLDAGATDNGRPYFVMELVGGIKITDYCDQHQLTTSQRLDLFIQVCKAIQHAHQKGIIHRDIKPSNVLVTEQDGVAVPKVIDFGIAKATQGRLTDETLFTAFEQFLGTPAYMSPEQTQLGSLDVDTRSDIYSLGVLLYELLTGKTPFDTKELMAAGLDEMRRTICEVEPTKPSTRLTQELSRTQRPFTPSLSPNGGEGVRRTGEGEGRIKELIHHVRGDLDWIVMKCLEKDRARRYETANGLAADIERHLNNEPVTASPPSQIYRIQKAVRRNKTAFAAAAAVVMVLMIGAVVSTWQAIRATQAKNEALNEKRRADEEAAKQEAINRFLNNMLASADPHALSMRDQSKGPSITMLEVLDAATREVNAGSLKDQPAIEAAICQTLGGTYLSLGQPAKATPLLDKALDLNRRLYGEQSDDAIGSLRLVAHTKPEKVRVKILQETLAMERALHGNEHMHVAVALTELADLQSWDARGRYNAWELIGGIEDSYREGLTLQRKLRASDPQFVGALAGMAFFLFDYTDKHAEAEELLHEALQLQIAANRKRHPMTARVLFLLSRASSNKRDYAQAESLCQEAITIQSELFGTNDFGLSASLQWFGDVLRLANKLPESEKAFRQALAIRRQATHGIFDAAWTARALAENLVEQRRFADAEELYWELLDFWEKRTDIQAYQFHLNALASVLKSENKLDEIEALYRRALEHQRTTLEENHIAVSTTMCQLGNVLASRNKSDEAADFHRQVHERIPMLKPTSSRGAILSLRDSLSAGGAFLDAEKLYEQLIQVESQKPEKPNLFLGDLLHDFGDLLCYHEQKYPAAAEQFLKALPLRRQAADLGWTLRSAAFSLHMAGRPIEAEKYARDALDNYRAKHKADDLNGTTWPTRILADTLYQQRNLQGAAQSYREATTSYLKFNDPTSAEYTAEMLVEVLTAARNQAELESFLNEWLTQQRQSFGEKSLNTAGPLISLVQCLKEQSKLDQAADRSREVAELIANSSTKDFLDFPTRTIPKLLDIGLTQQVQNVCAQVISLSPTSVTWLNYASWSLVMADEPDIQKATLAIELATAAIKSNPGNYSSRTMLGAALYRAGDWRAAIAELEKAALCSKATDRRSDLFFLAMSQQRAGATNEARQSYSHAADWLASHMPGDREFLRLRAEAESLLEVENSRP